MNDYYVIFFPDMPGKAIAIFSFELDAMGIIIQLILKEK